MTGSQHCQIKLNRCSVRSFWRHCRSAPTSTTFAKLLPRFWAANELGAALASFAQGNSTVAIARLHRIDSRLASDPDTGPETDDALRVRGRIIAIDRVEGQVGYDGRFWKFSRVRGGLFGGQWLDKKLGTSPWLLLLGVMAGISLGLYQLIRGSAKRRDGR